MDYKAKRHSILDSLKQELVKGYREVEVTVLNKKFKLRTLNEDEEVWVDGHVRALTPMAMISSRKAPKLAAAIREIDGMPVDRLFDYPDTMDKAKREEFDKNEILRRWWVRDQMLLFLAEDGVRPFVNELVEALEKLEDERNEAIKEVPN